MTNPNDSAFPIVWTDAEGTDRVCEGLTKREYFIAKAMQAMIANGWDFDDIPFDATKIADTVLKQLEK